MNTTTANVPDCPFCRQNNLLHGSVIAETDEAYLIHAQGSPGCYLIIPSAHAESPADIPDSWWKGAKQLLATIPDLGNHYNLSFNIGKLAGQTVQHVHMWVIPRHGGLPSSGMGLATLISRANKE